MHSRYKISKLSPSAQYNPQCRVYIEPGNIERYYPGVELNRWYAGATEDTPALCEQALTCTLYSPLSNRVGYVHDDIDTYVALAVLISRYEKRTVNEEMVHEIGETVRIGPHIIPGLRYRVEVLAIVQVVSETEATFDGKIALIQSILEETVVPEVVTHAAHLRLTALEEARAHTVLQPIVEGYIMLAIGDAPAARDVAFEYGSIVIHVEPNAPVPTGSAHDGHSTYRKITVVRWDPLIPFNAGGFKSAMSMLDLGSTGWYMTDTEVISPIGHNSIVTVRQVVTQLLMHRPRNANEDAAAMSPFVGLTPADWERLEAASRFKTHQAGE